MKLGARTWRSSAARTASAEIARPPIDRSARYRLMVERKATVAAPTAEEAVLPGPDIDGFAAELAGMGFTEAFVRAVMDFDPADLVALHLDPAAVFDQTPGPKAGDRIPA